MKTKFPLIIILVALMNSFFWYLFFPRESLQDAWEYNQLAVNIIEGNGFSVQNSPPYEPTIRRVPVYPLFVSFIYRIFGLNNDNAVFISQIILFALISVSVYYLGLLINAPPLTAGLAGIITALNPSLAGFTNELMSEILYTCLMLLFAVIFVKALKISKYKFYLAAGLIIGLGALCRPTAQLLVLFLAVILLVLFKLTGIKRLFSMERKLLYRGLIIMALSCAVTISPWYYHNYKHFDKLSLTSQVGEVLFQYTALLSDDCTFKGNLLASMSEKLATLYDKDFSRIDQWKQIKDMMRQCVIIDSQTNNIDKGWNNNWYSGRTYLKIEKIWFTKSVEFIRNNPVRYIITVLMSPVSSHANLLVPQLMYGQNIKNTNLFIIIAFKLFILVLVVTTLICLIKHFRNPFILILMAIAFYNIATFIPFTSGSRHIIVNLPLYSLFCAIAITGSKLDSPETKL